MISRTLFAVSFVLILMIVVPASAFQKRDHLTPLEVDRVKEAQILDKRIEVFIKAAERRVMVINGTAATNAKQLKKDAEKWVSFRRDRASSSLATSRAFSTKRSPISTTSVHVMNETR